VLADAIIAYEEFASNNSGLGESKSRWLVIVFDLRTGRVLHNVPTGTLKSPRPGLFGAGETTAIVVKPDGAVAWIVETGFKPKEYEVHALDKSGGRVLAVGTDIVPKSLALAGNILYWAQGGKPFSAPLK